MDFYGIAQGGLHLKSPEVSWPLDSLAAALAQVSSFPLSVMWGLCVAFLIGCVICQLSLNRYIELGGASAAQDDYRHHHHFRLSGGGGSGVGGGKSPLERSISPQNRSHDAGPIGANGSGSNVGGMNLSSSAMMADDGIAGGGGMSISVQGRTAAVAVGGAVAGPTAVHGRVAAGGGGGGALARH